MTTIHVFTDDTLSHEQAAEIVPAALLYPPARQGDLLGVGAPGDIVVIIDSDPYHCPRHDEILRLIGSGIAVAGAGGWGAVLAADMHPYGMTGIGEVFTGLLNGSIVDHEAADHRQAAIGYAARSDAREALTLAASGLLAIAVPAASWPRPAPGRAPWRKETCWALPARLQRLALYCPQWPARWRHYVLRRVAHAVGHVHPDELPEVRARRWLRPEETRLPIDEQARLVLMRVAVKDPSSPAWPIVTADAEELASGLSAPPRPFAPRKPRELARIWEVQEVALDMAALDRGFVSPASALRCAGFRAA
jgi:hypothetical protein